jgi:hypothetical protein
MSTNHLYSDKENVIKKMNHKILSTNTNNAENEFRPKKQPLQQSGQRRFVRVPLEGKDQNKLTLNKSQSSLNVPTTDTLQKRKVLMPKVPTLTKATSTLGFIHKQGPTIPKQPISYMPTEKLSLQDLKTDDLNSQLAERSADLIEKHKITDNLQKNESEEIREKIADLPSTITPQTNTLHASNIITHDVNINNVDPVKKSPKRGPVSQGFQANKTKKLSAYDSAKQFAVCQELINNDYEIEYVPKKATPLPYTPADIEPLDQSDYEFFSKPTRNVQETSHNPDIHQNELDLKFEEIDLDKILMYDFETEENKTFAIDENEFPLDVDAADIKEIGLSVEELEDLLD